jgi:5-(carboxyamino)imidazole ribonucleotide synthase
MTEPIPPGGILGILGGGQLGRMIALAAAELGYRTHVFTPEGASPAGQVATIETVADFDDEASLDAFSASVDAITLEWENIPVAAVERLARRRPVRPGAKALEVAQDRVAEKTFSVAQGARTAPFEAVDDVDGLRAALARIGTPAILKTRRFGYDGKGQSLIRDAADAEDAWLAIGSQPAILEGFVDFACEISVVGARDASGSIRCFDAVENRHKRGILDVTLAPARIGRDTAEAARAVTERLLVALDYVGVLTVEFFVARDGGVLVNEMAPRVHNSGHWSIEGALTSQFEQQARAALGLPLGDPSRLADAVMLNLIGDDAKAWRALGAEPRAKFHLYGKSEARPGRKMGHVTLLSPLDGGPDEPGLARLRALVGG